MTPCLLRFTPIYQERVWGGRALAETLGRILPPDKPIGESWEIVDRPEAQSLVAGGPWAGRTLRDLVENETTALMGPKWKPSKRFPILVKWLDARERMSLQVHPPKHIARKLGGEPKTENWFIAKASPDASLIVGLKRGVTRTQFEKAIHLNCLEMLLHRLPTKPGHSMFVPSGRLHAIDAGNLILEIQQNSDTTYRVYDWGRVGLDGKPRQLHVEESLKSIDFSDAEPALIPHAAKHAVLANSPEFRLRRVPLAKGNTLSFRAGHQPRILSVVKGSLALEKHPKEKISSSENMLIPYSSSVRLRAAAKSLVLVTEAFV